MSPAGLMSLAVVQSSAMGRLTLPINFLIHFLTWRFCLPFSPLPDWERERLKCVVSGIIIPIFCVQEVNILYVVVLIKFVHGLRKLKYSP